MTTNAGATRPELWKWDTACNNANSKPLGLAGKQGVSGMARAGGPRGHGASAKRRYEARV